MRCTFKSDLLIWQLTGGSASDLVSSDILWRKPGWKWKLKDLLKTDEDEEVCHMWSVKQLMTSGFWRANHVTSLDTGCWRTWPDKERCDIWSDKTCDQANSTSCSGGRALNWGLMERGLMKRNVTWLAMSLEDFADRSKISTPHSTLERRSQIWWRATLNYLVDEDHLRRWSNQMAGANNSKWFHLTALTCTTLASGFMPCW